MGAQITNSICGNCRTLEFNINGQPHTQLHHKECNSNIQIIPGIKAQYVKKNGLSIENITHFQSTSAHISDMFIHLKPDDLKDHDVTMNTEASEILVPFSIIKTSVSQQMLKIFIRFCQSKFGKFEEIKSGWRLNQRGNYILIQHNNFIIGFGEKHFYEGDTIYSQGSHIPHGKGILVTQQGIFKGSFLDGKACGEGYFVNGLTYTNYHGIWSEGYFINGTIENKSAKFIGGVCINFGQDRAQGKLAFKKNRSQFVGTFKNGLFQGDNCILKCQKYVYQGGFERGMKNGEGRLSQYEEKICEQVGSTRIKKYFPPESLAGNWQDDRVIYG